MNDAPDVTAAPDLASMARQAAFLLVQGRADAAAALCGHIQAIDPNLETFGAFVDLLIWARPRERLYPLVRALVDAGFANPRSFDLLAATAIWAGDIPAARELTSPERFLSITRLHGPDDPDLAPLVAELASGLEHYDRPGDRSIRMGSRRNHLERSDSPVLRRLLDRLWRVACDYVDRLPADPANPFLRARPAGLVLKAWSVVSGAETRHLPHLHATSWVNGVYYAEVPPVVADVAGRPGWLRVGPAAGRGFPAAGCGAGGWEERWIRPEPGLVVLMPSHFTHETVPLGCDQRRICVAFELHPAPPGQAGHSH
ncbi:putative 2OG-Fe(II) oxygenase [Tistrella mobilis]|uniref:TPR repeat protein n=1 Tax=Tistrella mobilis (strain KA081020-065) TaxID=1110502 RepID=I3TRQ9_TISMK|nr:putative 2OG-Fe(II) oxygenase [Tistrella mobilis]AFK55447.1 TPR repeat protein [Tistrella mobilis KA081020-065]